MKKRKFISGILAGALVITSVFTAGWNEAKAANEDNLVASYSFESGLTNDAGDTAPSAIVSGLGDYSGTPTYENGFDGKAIRLNGYGLKLNQQNLGDNFTVSMWMKADGIFKENQVCMFLGYHQNPEKWIGFSGGALYGGSSEECKFWAKDDYVYTSHTTLGTANVDTSWHKLTITGSAGTADTDGTVTAYLDGVAVGTGKTNSPLVGENQDIYIGVNYWNDTFSGLIDEVKVYNDTSTADEVMKDYLRDIGDSEAFKVASYSFENSLANAEDSDEASAIVSGLGSYNGEVKYEEGFKGDAIRLDGYGLKLNQKNLGENFTVSMWMKPDGVFKENQVAMFLGYHQNSEKWIGFSGGALYGGSSEECKFWAKDDYVYTSHTTLGTANVDTSWHKLTITGSAGTADTDGTVTAYLDGVAVGTGKTNSPLVGENQDIYIGVNYWNDTFSGLIDEVQVYQCTLTADEILETYLTEIANPEDDKLADFKFESSLADNEGNEASTLVTELKAYDSEVKYEAGFRGEAVRLGDYGLKLNKTNLGEDFTVSMWVKPDGTFAENQVLTFLGYHDPEQWIAVSGSETGTSECKFWANGNGYGWKTLGKPNINADGWHQLTITGTSSTVTAYLDGVQVGTGATNSPLNQEKGDIYIGVNNWDNEFSGLVDDVALYDRALTAGEISQIYTDDLLAADKEMLSIPDKTKWGIVLPSAGNSGQTEITWASSDKDVIDPATGEVTRPSKEQPDEDVTLTATIKTGSGQVTKEFTVKVLAENPDSDINDYADWLTLNAGYVSSDITLPDETGPATVTWTSNDAAISIDGNTGKVTRADGKNTPVTLTATVSLDGTEKTVTKEFPLTVLAAGQDVVTYISNAPATGQNGGMKIAQEDGDGFAALHSNQPVLYASKGTKSFGAAQIFRKADGTFSVAATDGGNNANLILFDSEDLITYSNERILSVPGVAAVKAVNCVYDAADKVYRIFIQDADNAVWMAESEDLTAISSVTASDYTFTSVSGAPEDAVNPYAAALTQDEYDALVKKFATITNTGVESPAAVEIAQGGEITLPETVTADYSDGSTKQLGVEWDADDLAAIDTSVPGTYTVEGTVQRTISYTDPENPLIEERADPFMTYNEDDGYYYFTGSYPMVTKTDPDGYDRLVLRRSKTIDGLADAQEVTIWDENESADLGRFIWAPELHKIGDSWYFVSTAGLNTGTGTTFNIRPFMIKCNNSADMMNPDSWGDPVLVKAYPGDETKCVNAMSLDMTYFEADGQSYLAWADFTQTGNSSIYIATINPENPTQLTSPCSVISVPEYSWEYVRATVNEGPAVFKNDGKVYMAFSASGTGSEYCVGMLTADETADLLDPDSWVKSNYPLLTSTDFNDEVSGPGHNSFTVDEYGNVIIVYHARPAEIHSSGGIHNGDPLFDPCRYAYLQPVNIAADGSPVLNMTPEQELADEHKKVTITVTVSGETDNPGTVDNATNPEENAGNANLSDSEGTLKDAVLTEDDKAQVEAGEDAKIYLTVEDISDTVDAADRELVEAEKGGAVIGMYLDVTLVKEIGAVTTKVEETNTPVTIMFAVPDDLRNTDASIERTYQIIRVHDGTAEILPADYDENTGILTFSTDKFSTYALAYTDKNVETEEPENPDIEKPGTDTENPDTEKPGTDTENPDAEEPGGDKAVQTGDTTDILPAAMACIFAFAGAVVVVGMKRRKRG